MGSISWYLFALSIIDDKSLFVKQGADRTLLSFTDPPTHVVASWRTTGWVKRKRPPPLREEIEDLKKRLAPFPGGPQGTRLMVNEEC